MGRPEQNGQPSDYVLEEFSPVELPAIEKGRVKAVDYILEMAASSQASSSSFDYNDRALSS